MAQVTAVLWINSTRKAKNTSIYCRYALGKVAVFRITVKLLSYCKVLYKIIGLGGWGTFVQQNIYHIVSLFSPNSVSLAWQ